MRDGGFGRTRLTGGDTGFDATAPSRNRGGDGAATVRAIHPVRGIYVSDQETGEAVPGLNSVQRYVRGSTTKLFPSAAALTAYGPDFRIETPDYRQGDIIDGTLDGDLILVASDDITLGGRDQPDGTLAHGNVDHTDANAVPGAATLTAPDPLTGLNTLAEQVAAAGIRQARDVIIDARLWNLMPTDDYVLSPIMINDNVIDLTVIPGTVGEATLEWRPATAFYDVTIDVRTVAKDLQQAVTITSPASNQIVNKLQIPVGSALFLQTFRVEDPPAFARTLFIEALARHGVTIDAPTVGANPVSRLPATDTYTESARVGLLRLLPFSEVIKVILKVSMNRGADTLVFLLPIKDGKRTFGERLQAIRSFIEQMGVDRTSVSLGDGRENDRADLFSPRSVAELLLGMVASSDFGAFRDALPILGVDGTEFTALPPTIPALGKIVTKSGTTIVGDVMNQEYLPLGKASAGYMTARSGRELIWAAYVNDALSTDLLDLIGISTDIGTIAEAIYEMS